MKLLNLSAVLMAATLFVLPVSAQENSIREETIKVGDQTAGTTPANDRFGDKLCIAALMVPRERENAAPAK